mmetsp:Transcript_30308/g.96703  ORF Transcript_30308/g.96703 Transcript_30308/m.96703 type:complete len:697 (-) Transcript_30308:323-2413(-)
MVETAAPDPVAHKLSELYLQWWTTPEAESLRHSILDKLQASSDRKPANACRRAAVGAEACSPERAAETLPLTARHSVRISAPADAPWLPTLGSPDVEAPAKRFCWGRPLSPAAPLSPIGVNTSPPRSKPSTWPAPPAPPLSPSHALTGGAHAMDVDCPAPTAGEGGSCWPAEAAAAPEFNAAGAPDVALLKRVIESTCQGGVHGPALDAAPDEPPFGPAVGAVSPVSPAACPSALLRSPPPMPPPPPPLQLACARGPSPSPCADLTAALHAQGLDTGSILSREAFGLLLRSLPTAPLPSAAAAPLWRALVEAGEVVRASALLGWFAQHLSGLAASDWLLPVLVGGSRRSHADRDDLLTLARDVMSSHPGLAFLSGAAEFQEHYAATVVARILYTLDPLRSGRVEPRQLRRGGALWGALEALGPGGAAAADINAERCFFSYEHFYVIFCTFCRLDEDSDHLLDIEDLARYGGHSLSRRTVERVYSCRRSAPADGLMDYEDFVFFLLSEEHTGSRTATGYWFRLLDVDGDGLITLGDMSYFYEEQSRRQAALGHEPVPFLDVAAQLLDAIHPRSRSGIALADLRRSRLAPLLIAALTNIHRFLAGEAGDARGAGPAGLLSEWDLWAAAEYARLEEEEEMEAEEAEVMGEAMDACPFDGAADAACEGLPPPPAVRDATAAGYPKMANGFGSAACGGVRV